MPEQSLSVEFKALCEAASDLCAISIERDDILNGELSEFAVGDQIFYRVFPSGVYSYFLSNGGSVVVIADKLAEITEEITFDGSDKANLSYVLDSGFSYTWIGSALKADPPHLKVTPNIAAIVGSDEVTVGGTNKSSTLPLSFGFITPWPSGSLPEPEPETENIYGIASVTYTYAYTSIKFLPINIGKQILLACRTCDESENCTSVTEEIVDQVFDDVTLTISDACESGIKVPGAQVEVDGELIDGVTDAGGQIHVGLLAKGIHTIKVTAPGYVDSDADYLSNDVIIVE